MAVAASKRLPESVAAYLESPGLSRLCLEWLSPLPAWIRQAVWNLIHTVIQPFSSSRPLMDLGEMDFEELVLGIERLERRPEAGPRRVESLAYVAASLPGTPVSRLIGLLPAGEERDSLCLRLIRHRWPDPRTARGLIDLFGERPMAREAECRLAIQEAETDSDWISETGRAPPRAPLDPADLGYEALILRLWKTRQEVSRKALAQTVLAILTTHEYRRALVVMRFWLHAHLSPAMRKGRPDKQRFLARVREGVRAAARLGS